MKRLLALLVPDRALRFAILWDERVALVATGIDADYRPEFERRERGHDPDDERTR